MSYRPCPLCGSDQNQFIFSERDHDLVQCQECELYHISPYPDGNDEIYETVAEYEYADLEIISCQRHFASSAFYFGYIYPMIRSHFKDARSVLDVGCGTGMLLEMLKEHPQIRRVGVELNKDRAKFSRETTGCEILEQPLERIDDSNRFDVIALINILAHVPNLLEFMQSTKRLLTPDGKAIVKISEMRSSVRKDAIHDWNIPDHVQFFGLKTMDRLAEMTGLKIVEHKRIPLRDEIFAKWRWRIPGRSAKRDLLKKVVSSIPFVLPTLKAAYAKKHGDSVFSSVIVLQNADASQNEPSRDE